MAKCSGNYSIFIDEDVNFVEALKTEVPLDDCCRMGHVYGATGGGLV